MRRQVPLTPTWLASRRRRLAAVVLTPWLALQGCEKNEEPAAGVAQAPTTVSQTKRFIKTAAGPREVLRGEDGSSYVAGQMLVRFKKGTSAELSATAHQQFGAQVLHTYRTQPEMQVVQVSQDSMREALEAYRSNPRVLYAEPNYVYSIDALPNDARFGELWGMNNTGQSSGTADVDINAPEAWDLTTGSGTAGVVTVVDTGVDYTHPDLADNIWTNPGEIAGNGIDDDGNGYIDDVHGINAITNTGDPMDDNEHGTHVSGTIAGRGNNGTGVAGVNWTAKVMGCKFLDSTGSGSLADAIKCFDYVHLMKTRAKNPVNIITTSNSWGGGSYSDAMYASIAQMRDDGLLFVAAASNDGTNNDTTPVYPNSYFLSNIISVAAHDRVNALASFSNYGRRTVHVSAPGVAILSTTPGNTYSSFDGTSMATPHVAGLVALLKAQDPSRDWRQLKNLVLTGGVTATSATGKTITGKRIRAADTGGKGSLTCNNQVLNTRVRPIANSVTVSIYQPVELISYNINCDHPIGNPSITVAPGGTSITLTDTGAYGDQTAGDGLYTGYFEPQAAGTYTLTFPDGETLTVNAVAAYNEKPVTYAWRTITGTNLNLTDDSVATITSPFSIPFAGASPGVTSLSVGMNGGIRTGSATAFTYVNAALPYSTYTTMVAPFWDDLYPGPTTADNVYWAVTGTAPTRELVVEWRNVHHRNTRTATPADTLTFQVVFFEGKSDILFNYKDTLVNNASYDKGVSATVGVQVSSTLATQHSYNTAGVADNTAILWTMPVTTGAPVISALDVSPTTLSEGDSLTANVTFTDPDGDADGPFKVEYDMDYPGWFTPDVTQTAPATGTFSGTATVQASGTVTVAVRVRDAKDVRSNVLKQVVTVVDVPPTLAAISAPASIGELQSVDFTTSFTDPGLDSPWKVEWDWNYDGSTFAPDQTVIASKAGAVTTSHAFPADGTYTVAARITDKDGVQSNVQVLTVAVADLKPGLSPISASSTHLQESQTLEYTTTLTDPGDHSSPWKVQWDYHYDGSTFNVESEDTMAAAGDIRAKRTMDESGTFTYAVRVVDADGSVSDVQTLTVIVDDVNPKLRGFAARALSTDENEPRTVSFTLSAESGADIPDMDPIGNYLWDFDGDGKFDYLTTTPNAIFTYRGNPKGGDTFHAVVRVEDEDSYSEASVDVVVRNAPPSLAALAPRSITEGQFLFTRALATDPGDDVLTFSLTGAPAGMSITADGFITWTPSYAQSSVAGKAYNVTVTVTDDDGATASQTYALTVRALDTDGDGIPDSWERSHGTDPNRNDAAEDSNGDGVSNLDEFNAANGGPALPEAAVAKSPLSGSQVDSAALVLTATNATSLGAVSAARYQFQLFADSALTAKVRDATVDQGTDGTTQVSFTDGTESVDLADLLDNHTYAWRVRVTDGTLSGPWSQVQTIRYNPVNDAPGAPRATQPMAGSQVSTLTPVLVVDNVTDVDDATVTYTFELAEDEAFTKGVQTSAALAAGERSTSWAVAGALKPFTTYFWRATAKDPHGASTQGAASSFSIFIGRPANHAPGAPTLSTPAHGSSVASATPALVAQAAVDADGDSLTYLFEVDTSATFGSAARQASSAVTAADGSVSWTPAALQENTQYFWRVRALDATSASDWAVGSFVVNAQNDAPSAPVALNPSEAVVSTRKPTLTVQNAVDPEGDAVTYSFEVRKKDSTDVVATVDNVPAGAHGITTATLSTELEEGSEYVWVAHAKDANGAVSAASAEAGFLVYRPGSTSGGGTSTPGTGGCSATPGDLSGMLPLLALGLGLLGRRRRNE